MNRKILWLAAGFILGQMGLAWAQSSSLPAHPTPVTHSNGSPQARIFPNTPRGGASTLDPNMRAFNKSYRQNIRLIQSNRKSGKWTPAQEKTALDGLKNIRRQEIQYFQQNKKRSLTGDQLSQLNTQLKQWGTN